jgi:deoxyribose-phosphate aldolase
VGYLKAKAYDKVHEDIKAVVNECAKHQVGVKVILEICLLDGDEIVAGSVVAREVHVFALLF